MVLRFMVSPKDRSLLVFASGSGAGTFGDKVVEPYYPMFITSLSVSPADIGLLNSIASFAGFSSQVFFGLFADSLGKRRLFVVFGYLFKGIFFMSS